MNKFNNRIFFLIGNIPTSFHSADLRAHFSNYVEKGLFSCFHYKHRPMHTRKSEKDSSVDAGTSRGAASSQESESSSTKCCVVLVEKHHGSEFLKMYQNKNWSQPDGGLLPSKVHISSLNVGQVVDDDSRQQGTAAAAAAAAVLPLEDVVSLPELNPPSVMPQGNVGTPLSTFMTLIRNCKLPSHVIKKLQLEFPKSKSSRRYGAVAYKYGVMDRCVENSTVERAVGDSDSKGRSDVATAAAAAGTHGNIADDDVSDSDEGDDIPPDDDHDAEEWERYEAFHTDVDKQERSNERLFEEELEVVWEKGGSGLVFYTDASYWDQQAGDFDEKCSQEDDWAVDMSVYYDFGGGDKDARDMRDMEMERRLREGEPTESWKGLGGFERHTKGIGSKLMKRSGWLAGKGIGAMNQGIKEPVESDGQLPFVKDGLGYRGEKLNRHVPKRRKVMKDVVISTVYDQPEEQESTVLRTAPPTVLKHRQQIQFTGGTMLEPNRVSEPDTTPQPHGELDNRTKDII